MLKIFYLKKNPGALYVTTHITHLKKIKQGDKADNTNMPQKDAHGLYCSLE